MKFVLASAMLVGSAAAFSSPAFVRSESSLMMSAVAETPTYTFEKSEEIFDEAKTVSIFFFCFHLS